MAIIFNIAETTNRARAATQAQADMAAAAKLVPELKQTVNDLQRQINELSVRNAPGNTRSAAQQPRDPRAAQFIANATANLSDLQYPQSCFQTAFANPVATPPAPAEDNPSNAKTVMQDGKAVYNDKNYTITANETNSEVTIFNKNTKETYKAWGDPHLDVDGKRAFDFYGKTSFKLTDGPKVTLDTVDAGNNTTFTSKVTITNGGYGAQIIGVDEKTKGDLAVKEFRNQGRELDRMVDDGVVLEENPDMTVNEGRGLVVTDANGAKRKVDQAYIDGVDLKKTLGQSSQNVDKFDSVPARVEQRQAASDLYRMLQQYKPTEANEQPNFQEACTPRHEQTSLGANRFDALRELMNWRKPAWNECFKSFQPARTDRGREQEQARERDRMDDMPARQPNRIKVKVDVRNFMDNNLNLAMSLSKSAATNMQLQVWG